MKKTYTYLLSAAALALASCSAGEEPVNFDQPVQAEFDAEIGDVASRAYGGSWETGDQIGISVASAGATAYDNVCYYTSGNGNFSPYGGPTEAIYFQDKEEVTITAYYPFSGTEGTPRGIIDANTSNQLNTQGYHFLWAQSKAKYSSPKVSLAFNHAITKLTIQLHTDVDAGFDADDVRSGTYSISGLRHSGTFNTATGVVTATGEPTQNWLITAAPTDAAYTRIYTLFLLPQDDADLTLTATIAGQQYECQLSPALQAGTAYTYTITVRKTGLSVANCSIAPWVNGDDATGTANPVRPS